MPQGSLVSVYVYNMPCVNMPIAMLNALTPASHGVRRLQCCAGTNVARNGPTMVVSHQPNSSVRGKPRCTKNARSPAGTSKRVDAGNRCSVGMSR